MTITGHGCDKKECLNLVLGAYKIWHRFIKWSLLNENSCEIDSLYTTSFSFKLPETKTSDCTTDSKADDRYLILTADVMSKCFNHCDTWQQ